VFVLEVPMYIIFSIWLVRLLVIGRLHLGGVMIN